MCGRSEKFPHCTASGDAEHRRQEAPRLPIVIWDKIASNLWLNEFVMLASTCKALNALQPQCLRAKCRSELDNRSLLRTLSRHWGAVNRLSLHVTGVGPKDDIELLNTGVLASQQMSTLKQASIGFWGEVQCCPRLQNAFVALLLAKCHGLHTLSLDVLQALCMPSFGSLRHLVMRLREGMSASAAAELGSLACLETLYLEGRARACLTLPFDLDLEKLVNLRSVALKQFAMASIRLPASGTCRLFVSGSSAEVCSFCVREAAKISSMAVSRGRVDVWDALQFPLGSVLQSYTSLPRC